MPSIFGVGFRIVLVALAVALERVGAWLREHPYGRMVTEAWTRFTASPPPGVERDVERERSET